MAIVGLPPPGVTHPAVVAPPAPSAALRAWVASHYAPKLRAGVLQHLAANPTAANRVLHGVTVSTGGPAALAVGKPVYTPGLAPPTSAATQNPYAAYPDYAQQALRQLDADKASAVQNAANVQGWLAPALSHLQQGQQAAQTSYGQTIAGLYGTGGAAGPGNVAASSPGGILAAPSNANIAGSQAADPLRAAGAQQAQGLQSLLGNLNIGDIAQGALGNVAYQATQIPAQYAAKKNEYLQTIDKALSDAQAQAASDAAKLAEDQRQFEIQNATTLRGQDIGLIRTTLGSGGSGGAAAGLKPSSSALPLAAGQTPPAGYQSYTEPTTGQTYAIKAPKPAGAGKPNTGSGGIYIPGAKNAQLVKSGLTAVRVPGGFRYVKPPTAAGGKAGGAKGLTANQQASVRRALGSNFSKMWQGASAVRTPDGRVVSGTPGIKDMTPAQGTAAIVNFMRAHPELSGNELLNIIGSIDPQARAMAERWLQGQVKG